MSGTIAERSDFHAWYRKQTMPNDRKWTPGDPPPTREAVAMKHATLREQLHWAQAALGDAEDHLDRCEKAAERAFSNIDALIVRRGEDAKPSSESEALFETRAMELAQAVADRSSAQASMDKAKNAVDALLRDCEAAAVAVVAVFAPQEKK